MFMPRDSDGPIYREEPPGEVTDLLPTQASEAAEKSPGGVWKQDQGSYHGRHHAREANCSDSS